MMRKFAGVFLLVAALAFAGCGSGDAGDDGENGGGGEAVVISPAVGVWTIEKDSLIEAALKQVPEEQREMARGMVEQQFATMMFELDIKEDGTFAVAGEMMGDKLDAAGTWTLEDGVFTVVTTEEDGAPKDPPEEKTGRFEDGKIFMTEEGMPFEMVLIKKVD